MAIADPQWWDSYELRPVPSFWPNHDMEDDMVDQGHEVVGNPPARTSLEAVQQALGLDVDCTEEQVLDRIQDLQIDRRTAMNYGPICDALGGWPHTTDVGQVIAEIERLQAAEQTLISGGLGPDNHALLAKALGIRDLGTPFSQMLEVALRQRIEAHTAREIYEPGDEMTMEEAERQRRQRQEALHTVMDLWAQHRLGEDMPDAEDLVSLTHFLATGDTSLVQEVQRQRLQFAQEERRRYELAPDAARCSGGGESE